MATKTSEKLVRLGRLQTFKTEFEKTFASVAKSGKAKDVSIDAIQGLTATQVQAALAELLAKVTGSDIEGEVAATPSSGMLKTYVLKKNGVEMLRIDIPKDLVAVSGTVKTYKSSDALPSGVSAAGTYIEMTVANGDPFYIDVSTLIEYVTSGSTDADKVQVKVDATTHKVTATIKTGSIEKSDLKQDVQQKIDGALQGVKVNGTALDADSEGKVNIPVANGTTKGVSTNDYTTDEKQKLAEIEYATDEDIIAIFSETGNAEETATTGN